MSAEPVHHERSHDDTTRTLVLSTPPGNVLDSATCRALSKQLEIAAACKETRLLVLRGSGKHFSYGASVEEHLPEQAPGMLEAMGDVVRRLVDFPYPTLAAVTGRCLGGGFEVALACGMLYAEEGAVLAAPEIRLGVFAPAATALLDGAVSPGVAEDVLLTGRDVPAEEAVRLGLATRLVPAGGMEHALHALVSEHLAPRSPASLRVATRALRQRRALAVTQRLAELERLYVDELLKLEDGSEGIRAFLEKRPPRWRNA